MLGAVVRQSIFDAWQCGHDRAAFRGYWIETRRIEACGDGRLNFRLTLRIDGAVEVLDHLFIAVALQPAPGPALAISFDGVRILASHRTGSFVGCVSPFDARHASPETGQIS